MRHDDELARGKAARATTPRSALGTTGARDRDPVAILEAQNVTRLPDLVDLRMQRMTANPFAFYRGTAAIMAADLANDPTSGISIISCGDAHISNFGLYASPQRTLLFDLNDFDEAARAPWEWDLKRLVTSVVIGARDNGYSEELVSSTALHTASEYRRTLLTLMSLPAIERYYRNVEIKRARKQLSSPAREMVDRAAKQARKRTSDQAVSRMSAVDDAGNRFFVDTPPVLTRLSAEEQSSIRHLFDEYRATVSADIALLLSQHELTDIALRVVGVGSVGTRCFVLLLTGPAGEALVLQVKQAEASVLQTWGGIDNDSGHQGSRVVDNQRILQAISDPFLGHLTGVNGWHFYVRQFRDMKGSVDIAGLTPYQFETYVGACAGVLARAHSQNPEAAAIAGYVGASDAVDRAVLEWSLAYADQSLEDFERASASSVPSMVH